MSLSSQSSPVALKSVAVTASRARRASKVVQRAKLWGKLYLLMAPSMIGLAVFNYYPKFDVVRKSFYRWTPGRVLDYIGLGNFLDVAADPLFWQSIKLVFILLAANLFKMWPAMVTAIALHRLVSNRWRYIYQVLFVVPMVIPTLVWLLIWKGFYDADFGILNRILNATGLMHVLAWLDGTDQAPGLMPRLAAAMVPIREHAIQPVFGSIGGLLLTGAAILLVLRSDAPPDRPWLWRGLLLVMSLLVGLSPAAFDMGIPAGLGLLAMTIGAASIMGAMPRSHWLMWTCLVLVGLWAMGDQPLRLPILIGAALILGIITRRDSCRHILRTVGWGLVAVAAVLTLGGAIWTVPTNQFATGTPAWLGNEHLIIPAIVFWGFPWVGTISVLIYLAGLQQISVDVYDAAEIDGVGPLSKAFYIELPLLLTQVRINLIFMTIGTLTGFELFLILLGSSGGPGNKGMVPGLYMYKKAFEDLEYGYACALGMVLFVTILALTLMYQKYLRVER